MDLQSDLNNKTKEPVQDLKEPKGCTAIEVSNDTSKTDKSEKENSQNDVTSNLKDQATDKISPNQEVKQVEPSSDDNFHNGGMQDEEPVAKKSRITASAFLQLSDPVTNTNVISNTMSEDIKSYLTSTSNEITDSVFTNAFPKAVSSPNNICPCHFMQHYIYKYNKKYFDLLLETIKL